MIKANELRIGNLVLYKPYGNRDGEMKTIQGMMGMKAYFNRHSNEGGMYHHLQPIPLTAEILERCGFNFNHYTYNWDRSQLSLAQSDFSPGVYEIKFIVIGKPIERLHQLQNLYFAITGEELEIKP
jgi:hypothetical protein